MKESKVDLDPAARRVWAMVRALIAVSAATAGVILVGAPAFAENPLYCNSEYTLNNGCNGPTGVEKKNEGRNENGGCIAIQWWYGSYGPVREECAGGFVRSELTTRQEDFPRCWNRTNAKNLIHCRYELWPT
jgi:hypothetical protein